MKLRDEADEPYFEPLEPNTYVAEALAAEDDSGEAVAVPRAGRDDRNGEGRDDRRNSSKSTDRSALPCFRYRYAASLKLFHRHPRGLKKEMSIKLVEYGGSNPKDTCR